MIPSAQFHIKSRNLDWLRNGTFTNSSPERLALFGAEHRAYFLPVGVAMYSDPALIRDVIIQVRLNDNEAELLDAVVKYTGQQKSTLMRELFLRQAQRVLMGEGDLDAIARSMEPAQLAMNY